MQSNKVATLIFCLFGFALIASFSGVVMSAAAAPRAPITADGKQPDRVQLVTDQSAGVELVIRNGSAWDCVCLNVGPAGGVWTAQDSSRDWYSITSSADGTKLAAIVKNGQIYTSTDSGVSWTARDSNRDWSGIASSSDGTKLIATVDNGGQIYASTDSGVSWTARDSARDWVRVASSSDGTKLAAVVG